MKLTLAMLALLAVPAAAQVSYPPEPMPTSFADTSCANCSMSSPVFTGSPTLNGYPIVASVNSQTGTVVLPILTQYSKANLATNSAGVSTITLPANTFVNPPSIAVTPRAAGVVPYVTTAGTATAGFTVTVTFWKIATTVAALGGATTVAITSPVNFDIVATDTN